MGINKEGSENWRSGFDHLNPLKSWLNFVFAFWILIFDFLICTALWTDFGYWEPGTKFDFGQKSLTWVTHWSLDWISFLHFGFWFLNFWPWNCTALWTDFGYWEPGAKFDFGLKPLPWETKPRVIFFAPGPKVKIKVIILN